MKSRKPPNRRPRQEQPGQTRRRRSKPRHTREKEPPSQTLEKQLLAFLHLNGSPLSSGEIQAGLGLGPTPHRNLNTLLLTLCKQRRLVCTPDQRYAITKDADIVEGRLEMNPRGFGFAILGKDNDPKRPRAERQDPFVPPTAMGNANHGDRVLFKVTGRRGRQEARVVQVLERAASRLPGIYVAGRQTGYVIPEDERHTFKVIVRKEFSRGAKDGNAVEVEITDYLDGRRNPEGRIIEVLGDPDDVMVQTRMVISKFRLPHAFPPEVERQVSKLSADIPREKGRADLRQIFHVTIDGETARDFDDAVAIVKSKQGFRLYVSIADVSHYVKPDSPLDREAYQRGTSVYFPTMVIPMLPERLSNDLCSLVPDQDRVAFTAILDFDRTGKRLAKKFTKSVIKSHHRLTYTLVRQLLVDQEPKKVAAYGQLLQPLKEMAELGNLLEKRRQKRGSIGFTLPEPQMNIDENGTVTSISRAERNLAHKLIEEFMLAANEAVAATFTASKTPALYRIHEAPDAEKVEEFTDFGRSMGLALPPDTGTPQWFGKILAMVADSPREYIVNNLLLRTMQRARYSPANVGHFGLAAADYTHFTSPIRRYPDLMVHRALAQFLTGGAPEKSMEELTADGDFLSGRERTAIEADREITGRLQIRFMADKVGESFAGVISGATPFGLFIELLDIFASGAIPIAELKDDYYQYDDRRHQLVGGNSGRTLQMGDVVRVTVASVEPKQRHINFRLEAETSR